MRQSTTEATGVSSVCEAGEIKPISIFSKIQMEKKQRMMRLKDKD